MTFVTLLEVFSEVDKAEFSGPFCNRRIGALRRGGIAPGTSCTIEKLRL